jgi:hypothetical protein
MDIWGKIGVIVGTLTFARLITKDIIEWKFLGNDRFF